MHPYKFLICPSLLILALAGCGDSGGSSGPEIGTFERIQTQVFDQSCSSDSCHSSVGRAGDMILEAGHSLASLVNQVPSNPISYQHGYMRVMPGDPDMSLLLMKLTNNLSAGEGRGMPYNAAPLSPDTVEVIRAWILAGAPEAGRVEGDDGRDLTGGIDEGELILPNPARGVQIRTTSPAVPMGKEETGCHFMKMPSDTELDINRIQVAVTGGSHHIHLYRAIDRSLDLPDHYEVCNMAVDFNVWQLVVAVQLRRNDWELPPGVAFYFRPGEQILVQTHFVNVGSLETIGEGKAVLNLHAAEPGTVTAHAGAIFGQDKDVFVPAHTNPTKSAECVFPKPTTLIAQSGHYHFRGRRFLTFFWNNGVRGEEFYRHEGYDDPLFAPYDQFNAPFFDTGEGLQWECYWENPTNNDFAFGPFTDTNEHCNWFGFYYPTSTPDESMTCVKKDGVAVTTVHSSQ